MSVATLGPGAAVGGFRHEAFLYGDDDEFTAGTAAFVREGLASGERVLVVVARPKIERLRRELGADAGAVRFADMAELGGNPARIIPAWREFVDDCARSRRRPRGIGEPVWPGRTPAALAECQLHECLLNVAFADSPPWRLMCPYDATALEPDVLDASHRSHPFVQRHDESAASDCYDGDEAGARFDAPLPPAPPDAAAVPVDAWSLQAARDHVAERAAAAGVGHDRAAALVLAVNELTTNSVRHGGGRGLLRTWEDGGLVCEVSDAGHIRDVLAGRRRPPLDRAGGRGLWLVNQLCDLVQLRSSPAGTVVRAYMAGTSGAGVGAERGGYTA